MNELERNSAYWLDPDYTRAPYLGALRDLGEAAIRTLASALDIQVRLRLDLDLGEEFDLSWAVWLFGLE